MLELHKYYMKNIMSNQFNMIAYKDNKSNIKLSK